MSDTGHTLMARNWTELQRPNRMEVEEATHTPFYGKFTCAPLERGFGITLGNALRRVLLSSLQGAAFTKVKIEGVLHEFSTIPGVKEDVTDLILNLKKVNLRLRTVNSKTLRLEAVSEGEVRAGDIITDETVEVVNPGQILATLSKEGKLSMTMTVAWGKGYVPAEFNKSEDDPIGTLALDSVFSPIRKVSYKITNARVGRRTDYDKLTMEIWTNGTVLPEDALSHAAKILREQFQVFQNFEDQDKPIEEEKPQREPEINENLYRSVAELELSVRSANCLKNADIKFIGELVQKTESEMLKTKNFGRKSLNEIKEILADMDLHLGMPIPDFPSRAELERRRVETENFPSE
ncbi:MAG: DNA-directed polymerase subunit alpha [Thermodesulfobacteriota bacterium]|nr:DNA-directed polymerase subunit alpha [Thermodesulfobacteriota bacterium]